MSTAYFLAIMFLLTFHSVLTMKSQADITHMLAHNMTRMNEIRVIVSAIVQGATPEQLTRSFGDLNKQVAEAVKFQEIIEKQLAEPTWKKVFKR